MTSSARRAPFDELASLRARVQQFESQIVERNALLEQRTAAIARHEVTIEQHEATADSGPSRSPIPDEPDHRFRSQADHFSAMTGFVPGVRSDGARGAG